MTPRRRRLLWLLGILIGVGVAGALAVRFVVTDFKHSVPVRYASVLPDLFREAAGVLAHGRLEPNGTFIADEVLANHDEKYLPPEVARSLKQAAAPAAAGPC